MHIAIQPLYKKLEKKSFEHGFSELLSDVFSLCACKISMLVDIPQIKTRQNETENILEKYRSEEIPFLDEVFQDIFNICACPAMGGEFYDYLGELYMNSQTSSKKAGQFFTPYHLSEMCARLVSIDFESNDVITVDEPACGSGGMLLAYANILRDHGINYSEKLFCHGADLDGRCVRMAYIQLSLAGIPAIIHRRNTLTMETYEEWHTPAYVFNYLKFRKHGRNT